MTYRSIAYRLELGEDYSVRSTVKARPELFRMGALSSRIEEWKAELRTGQNEPSWIREITDPVKKATAIEGLGPEDVFRSQFRAHRGAGRSPIEIIQWGLDHLERLRKAKMDSKDATAKKWQIWLVFWVSVAGVISQFLIALAKLWTE